ncbi:MAG: ribosome maturation factor RimM [Chromatiales bacterium 21-64-14]|nr:MAG: ribosome maturation factor RimM [Chromatiales bacterium 21-64-14]HQU14716.1 ribosome maturation factor RimM [Gammaproteobacteria bacterium]
MSLHARDMVPVGRVSGVYGVRGWVRIHSYTEPREAVLDLVPWFLRDGDQWQAVAVHAGRRHGRGVVACLADCAEPVAARALMGREIGVRRGQFPSPEPGRYYWVDLEGLRVETLSGHALGVVAHLLETGANDVLVVRGERERLIPFVPERVVTEVDLEGGVLKVDWDPEF